MRTLYRFAAVILVAASAIALAIAPRFFPQTPARAQKIDVAAAVTRVCPVADPKLAPSTVLLANVQGLLKVRDVADPDSATSVSSGSLSVQEHSQKGIQSDVAPGGKAGASSQTSQTSGIERGLSGTSCSVPTNTFWFPAVAASSTASTTLYLSSIDDGGAAVDLTFFGSDGRLAVAGSRSITVRGHTTEMVVLSSLVKAEGDIGLQVQASSGRIAAFARTRHNAASQNSPSGDGVDWSTGSVSPDTTVVIPSIPSGGGDRVLNIVNPGDRMATYSVEYISADGVSNTNAGGHMSVGAQSHATLMVSAMASGKSGSVVVHADQPVVASVVAAAQNGDFAVVPSQHAFTGTAVIPVAQAKGQSVVEITAQENASVEIIFTDANGTQLGDPVKQRISKERQFSLGFPAGNTVIGQINILEGQIFGGVVQTADLGGFTGLTVYPLTRAEGGRTGINPTEGLG